MKLYVIRHTTPEVAPNTCYGVSDLPPTSTFADEASQTKQLIEGVHFTQSYSSPLCRCQLLADKLVDTYVLDDRIKELNFGDWELKTWDYINSTAEGQHFFNNYTTARALNGESFIDQVTRVRSFTDELHGNDNDSILIVTHMGVIKALKMIIEKVSIEEALAFTTDYGSLTTFDYKR